MQSVLYKQLNSIANSLRAYYLEKTLKHYRLNFRTFDAKFIKKLTNRFKILRLKKYWSKILKNFCEPFVKGNKVNRKLLENKPCNKYNKYPFLLFNYVEYRGLNTSLIVNMLRIEDSGYRSKNENNNNSNNENNNNSNKNVSSAPRKKK